MRGTLGAAVPRQVQVCHAGGYGLVSLCAVEEPARERCEQTPSCERAPFFARSSSEPCGVIRVVATVLVWL